MEWKTIKHTISTDGVTEKIHLELMFDFPTSQWNKKEHRPVLSILYVDRKDQQGWWLDDAKTKWYNYPPHKRCYIGFSYFQSHPSITLYSGDRNGMVKYEDFTLEYCMSESVNIFNERLSNIMNQIIRPSRIILTEQLCL